MFSSLTPLQSCHPGVGAPFPMNPIPQIGRAAREGTVKDTLRCFMKLESIDKVNSVFSGAVPRHPNDVLGTPTQSLVPQPVFRPAPHDPVPEEAAGRAPQGADKTKGVRPCVDKYLGSFG